MPTSYALLSTYPPTQCGLATFAAALVTNLPRPGDQVAVVRVLDEPAPRPASEVVHHLVAGSVASAVAAADVLNSFDVAIVQHEYGIYGGADGQDVVSLLQALCVPTIVGFAHGAGTAVAAAARDPRCGDRWSWCCGDDDQGCPVAAAGLLRHSRREGAGDTAWRGRQPGYRIGSWGIQPPHGADAGLLGPGKGIEHAIDAMAMLRGRGPYADYRAPHARTPRPATTQAERLERRIRRRASRFVRHAARARLTKGHG
jgi:polysaccharide biosynthesis protein PslF